MALDPKLVDKRIVKRSIEQAKVDAAEYTAWLESLPDRSDRLTTLGDDARGDGARRK